MQVTREDVMEAIRFGLVGIVNTAAGLGTIYLAMWFGVAPVPANMIGYAVGIVVSFTLNRLYTFKGPTRPGAVLRFLVCFAISYGVNLAVLTTVLALGVSPWLAQPIAMVSYTGCFFLISKFYVFAPAR
ncbi:MAG: GtrA family protein [Pseudomonadota bacterium]